jgi:ATP-binding cassette subfamily A (ABC1) protein 3
VATLLKMLLLRQTWTLTWKNILIVLFRHPFSTPLRCFLLPVIFIGFLAYARNLFIPPAHYGIGKSIPVRTFSDALDAAGGGRNRVVLVNGGLTGGDIQTVIQDVASTVKASGKDVEVVSSETELLTLCRSTLRGTSTCYGAAVFYASPTEGPGGMWNYSLRADGGLGTKIYVTADNNDVEIYLLPLQHAIDFAIASHNSTIDQGALPNRVYEYPFTSETQQQRNDRIRVSYMGGIINILAVAFFIGIVGVTYQLVGLVASERELGMTQIIEASMPNKRRWEPQLARLMANHIAFDMMFLPGWFVAALILKYGVFAKTSLGVLIVFNLLAGLSLSSFSLFGGAFFHKAQLSGISTTIISLLLAVLAQVIGKASTGAVAILSLLFPPMNYTFFTILMARWERKNIPTNLVKAAPENPSTLPGIVFFIFLIVQILVYPILGALVERTLYGTASPGRKLMAVESDSDAAVELSGFTKTYKPSWWARNIATRFGKRKDTVTAVDNLDLQIPRGQITVLLGANGSGKTTTLETIAGLNTVTSGTVTVDGRGGLGVCPQRNVLWDQLTSYEHVRIFNRLKSTGALASKAEIEALIASCDLAKKSNAKARTLSGGQKRKLQLSMMFTGGSRVCCVDECSSGVDALARQKLWQILLAERGARTIIFTTHFLDEADLLSDQIAILSKGNLKAQGSAVELKHRLGGGYRIHVYNNPGRNMAVLEIEGATRKVLYDQTVYTVPDSAQAAALVRMLEAHGINNYEITSPTIEEIFFRVAENMELSSLAAPQPQDTSTSSRKVSDEISEKEGKLVTDEDAENPLKLQTGNRIGVVRQALTLFRKRFTVFQRNWFPFCAAFLIPGESHDTKKTINP